VQAPLPPDEERRLEVLHGYGILDTGPEQVFDDITLLASHICKTPIALISLVDGDRQWFKSKVGVTESETSRDIAFCAHGILQAEVFVVKDAKTDERFAANPLVTGEPGVGFYAGAPLIASGGHAIGMLCVIDKVPRDLSEEQKAALQALSRQVVAQLELRRSLSVQRESDQRFAGAFELAPIGMALVAPDGRWLQVNEALSNIVGYSGSELLARTFQSITYRDDLQRDLEHLRQLIAGETRNYQMEKRYVHKRGHLVTVLLNVSLVRDDQGGPRYFIAQIQDITERKKAEDDALRSQKRLRDLIDGLGPSMFVGLMTPEGVLLESNRSALVAAGLKSEDVIGKPFAETYWWCYSPQIQHQLREAIDQAALGKASRYDVRIRVTESQFIDVDFSIQPVRDEWGEVVFLVPSGSVITERKLAESELRFNEQRFRSLVEATTAIVWDTPASGEFEVVQPSWAAFTGQSFEGYRGWGWLDAVHPEDRPETARVWSAAVASRSIYRVEHRLRAADGTYHDMMVHGVPIFAEDGAIVQWIGIHTDITERKRTELLLRLLGSAVEQSVESILMTDGDLDFPGPRITFVNPAFTKMTGYTAEEVIGKTPRLLQGPRTDKAVLTRLRQTLESGEVFEGETINYRKDGTEFNLEWQIAPIRDLEGKTTHYIAFQRDVTERKRSEDALRESNEKFHQLADNITDVFWVTSTDFKVMYYVSPGYELIWGRSAESLYAHPHQWVESILPEERESAFAVFGTLMGTAQKISVEYRISRPDGTIRWIHDRGFQVRDAAGKAIRITGIASDITERKRLEARLFQAQKMETVGKLAGGVAHEFNSILTAIIGRSELLMGDLPAESPLAKSAGEISKAAGRAAVLTRQLLAYGRKQLLQPETLDLNRKVVGMEAMLAHLMGVDVNVRIVATPGVHPVKADASQIEQVIINLAMNARDAMPNGGKLTLETANVSFDEESADRYPELKPGDYVMLAITDTGTGMSAEVKARLFEPFFSTKSVGEGTGLGLSTCYGIVKQSGGLITVYTELGRGTTFKIYLPQTPSETKSLPRPRGSIDLPRGTETILLVEDDPALREMAAELLGRLGYVVLVAADGVAALSLLAGHSHGLIHLLFSDVVMPQMDGKELADRVLALTPETKILFTSAYTENAIVHQGALNTGVSILQKPFTPSALAQKVREMLDDDA
jgi:two-component system cell cycle sensor histidine kinase/response regulator CckA